MSDQLIAAIDRIVAEVPTVKFVHEDGVKVYVDEMPAFFVLFRPGSEDPPVDAVEPTDVNVDMIISRLQRYAGRGARVVGNTTIVSGDDVPVAAGISGVLLPEDLKAAIAADAAINPEPTIEDVDDHLSVPVPPSAETVPGGAELGGVPESDQSEAGLGDHGEGSSGAGGDPDPVPDLEPAPAAPPVVLPEPEPVGAPSATEAEAPADVPGDAKVDDAASVPADDVPVSGTR